MFEVIKLILESLAKILDPTWIANLRHDKKKRKIGADLFLLYTSLNEILVCGDRILKCLEGFKKSVEEVLPQDESRSVLEVRKWIAFLLTQQRVNLVRFARAAQRLGKELQVIDGDSYRMLLPLIEDKRNAIDSLLTVLGAGDLPLLGPPRQDLVNLQYEFFGEGFDGPITGIRPLAVAYPRRTKVLEQITQGALFVDAKSWNDIYRVIKTYLTSGRPREQLREIEYVLKQLRASLEQHFSIADVLMDVGDASLNVGYEDGEHFWWPPR